MTNLGTPSSTQAGASQTTPSGGRVRAADWARPCHATSSVQTSPLPTPLPPNSVASVLSTSTQRPAWQAEPVAVAWHRREVGDAGDGPSAAVRIEAQERVHALVGVVGVDPAKPSGEKSAAHSAGSAASTRVERAHQRWTPRVHRSSSRCQSRLRLSRPLALLRELAAHEQQLLAGVRPHPRVQRPQVGELLPAVARHLVQQRALARARPRRGTAAARSSRSTRTSART